MTTTSSVSLLLTGSVVWGNRSAVRLHLNCRTDPGLCKEFSVARDLGQIQEGSFAGLGEPATMLR